MTLIRAWRLECVAIQKHSISINLYIWQNIPQWGGGTQKMTGIIYICTLGVLWSKPWKHLLKWLRDAFQIKKTFISGTRPNHILRKFGMQLIRIPDLKICPPWVFCDSLKKQVGAELCQAQTNFIMFDFVQCMFFINHLKNKYFVFVE